MDGLDPDRERRLVADASRGDRVAFEALWAEYQPRLLRYIASIGLQDADDVASQTWLEVFAQLDRLDDRPGALRRLLFTVARRRMIDEVRRVGRSIADVSSSTPSAETEVVDLYAALELLRQLPAAQADVVALRVIGGFSAAEVGAMTGQSEGAVRAMGHRALRGLHARLSGDMDEAGDAVSESMESNDPIPTRL